MIRVAVWVGVLVIVVAAAAATVAYRNRSRMGTVAQPVHIVLIGASIGQAWNLAGWPTRTNTPQFTAESIAAWQFDKSAAVEEVLLRPSRRFRPTLSYAKSLFEPAPRKPDIAILKECSSYFPGDMEAYKGKIRDWSKQIRAHNIQVILATVVPVTRARASQDVGKQEAIVAYNRWVREYAKQERFAVLDLEAALRDGSAGAYLQDKYTSGDGSHLNAAAYAELDGTLRNLLCAATPVAGCRSNQAAAR